VELFSQFVDEDIATLRRVSRESRTQEGYLIAMSNLVGSFTAGADRAKHRALRTRIVAASLTRPELRLVIGRTQQRLTEELTEVVRFGQDAGWLRNDLSPHALAVAVQALTIGRTLDDVSATPITSEELEPLLSVLLLSMLRSD